MRLTTYNYDHRLQLSTDQTISTAAKRPYQRARNQIYTLLNQLSQPSSTLTRNHACTAQILVIRCRRCIAPRTRPDIIIPDAPPVGVGRRPPASSSARVGSLKRQSRLKLLTESHSTMQSPWNVRVPGLLPLQAHRAGLLTVPHFLPSRPYRRLQQARLATALTKPAAREPGRERSGGRVVVDVDVDAATAISPP